MPATRSVFYGFGAWVGQQTGVTTCGWWPNDPTYLNPRFDPNQLIHVDLAKNPQAVRNKVIQPANIEVDDAPLNGGGTKLGPSWPTGSALNSCWLESTRYDALPAGVKPPRINYGMQCREYELTTVLYWDGPMAGRRFWGFHAEITSEQGQQALCSIWPAGKSQLPRQPPAGSWWIDMTTQAHPIERNFTEIGVGPGVPKTGALFIDAPTAGNLTMSGPKIPPMQGYDRIPLRGSK